MKVGDTVQVTWPEGTLGFSPPDQDGIINRTTDLKVGQIGIVTSVELNGIVHVVFPPGIVYEVVGHHLSVIA